MSKIPNLIVKKASSFLLKKPEIDGVFYWIKEIKYLNLNYSSRLKRANFLSTQIVAKGKKAESKVKTVSSSSHL